MAKAQSPRLAGRVVVVAGADTATGADTARMLAADGAALVLVGSDAEALGALAAELRDAGAGVRFAVFVGDPGASDDDRAALAEMVGELFADAPST